MFVKVDSHPFTQVFKKKYGDKLDFWQLSILNDDDLEDKDFEQFKSEDKEQLVLYTRAFSQFRTFCNFCVNFFHSNPL